ncbi:hypothetical protein MBLNU230_g6123t1 [Neophaeotheca triangularis]
MTAARPTFDPVDTSFDASAHAVRDTKDDVESPSLSNKSALARYEISNAWSQNPPHQQQHKDGTKVLLVEWTEDATSREVSGDWEISWAGKRTVLPAREDLPLTPEEEPVNRLYFLLGAGVPVPTAITLQKGPTITWKTNPLPAIFSPELGATARQAGKKGVLHTIWAKKRLQVLSAEIAHELKHNAEGIGLEMATAEKSWIEDNFGVQARQQQQAQLAPADSTSPVSPRTPGGGRLSEKLRGLGLSTTTTTMPLVLSGSGSSSEPRGPPKGSYQNPLSPETSDVAVGSFGSFAAIKGAAPMGRAKQPGVGGARQQQQQGQGQGQVGRGQGMGSLDASLAAAAASAGNGIGAVYGNGDGNAGLMATSRGEEDREDDLFALPMSPRSPPDTATAGRGAFAVLK